MHVAKPIRRTEGEHFLRLELESGALLRVNGISVWIIPAPVEWFSRIFHWRTCGREVVNAQQLGKHKNRLMMNFELPLWTTEQQAHLYTWWRSSRLLSEGLTWCTKKQVYASERNRCISTLDGKRQTGTSCLRHQGRCLNTQQGAWIPTALPALPRVCFHLAIEQIHLETTFLQSSAQPHWRVIAPAVNDLGRWLSAGTIRLKGVVLMPEAIRHYCWSSACSPPPSRSKSSESTKPSLSDLVKSLWGHSSIPTSV